MNVQHATASYHSYKSPIHSTLLSAVPEGMQRLAACIQSVPEDFCLTAQALDEIAEGKHTEIHIGRVCDGLYLQYMLPQINWWVQVAEALTFGGTMKGVYADPAYKEMRTELLSLLNATFSSYTAAIAATQYYSDSDDSTVHFDLLKRYRMLTKFVCSWAKQLWPKVDLDWLYGQA
jgi:hypothetical protein